MMRSLPLIAGAALVAGCLVADTGEVRILPEAPLEAVTNLRVHVTCPCTRVSLEIDHERLPGEFEANQDLDVPVSAYTTPGAHTLTARALDGSTARSASRSFALRVSRAPAVVVRPPTGGLARPDPVTDVPFVAEVQFDRPLASWRIDASTVRVEGETADVSVQGDGRTLRVRLTRSLDAIGAAGRSILLHVAGNVIDPPWAGPGWLFEWHLLPPTVVKVSLLNHPYDVHASGLVDLSMKVEAEFAPPWIDLHIGPSVVHLTRPAMGPVWPLVWDATSVAEGLYGLRPEFGPDYVLYTGLRQLYVDHTAPRVGTYQRMAQPGVPSRDECLALKANEDLGGLTDAVVRTAGVERAATGSVSWSNGAVCPEPLALALHAPEQEYEFRLTDLAGNRSEPIRLTVSTPLWPAVVGEGAVPSVPPVKAVQPGRGATPGYPGSSYDWLLALPAEGAPEAGQLLEWIDAYGAPPTRALNRIAGVAEQASWVWVERVGSGAGQVHGWLEGPTSHDWVAVGPLNRDPLRDAADASVSPAMDLAAWSEEVGDGRVIAAHGRSGPLGTLPRAAPGSVATAPALARGQVVAWLERLPGGPRRVQVAKVTLIDGDATRWAMLLTDGNLDPAAEASEVTVARVPAEVPGMAVAWREGGLVLARHRGSYGDFSPPVVLNADPARPARSPRLDLGTGGSSDQLTVYWIEETAEGDRIFAREWDGGGWALAPTPVNEGVPGGVTALGVGWDLVAWVLEDGTVRVRQASAFY